MAEDNATQIRDALRHWISADDEIRGLQAQVRTIRERKNTYATQILEFMRGQNLDNFVIDGPGGMIARQQRTTRARPNRAVVRTQIALLLADQPQRMAEVLRTIEGVPEPGQDDAGSVTTRELLMRRMPRTQRIQLE